MINQNQYLSGGILSHVHTVGTASKKWNISESALRKAISVGKFNVDEFIRRDSTYLILDNAMDRVYGQIMNPFSFIKDVSVELNKIGIQTKCTSSGYFEKDENTDSLSAFKYIEPTEIDCTDRLDVTNFPYNKISLFLRFSTQGRKLSIGVRIDTRSKKIATCLQDIYNRENINSINPKLEFLNRNLHKSIVADYYNEMPEISEAVDTIKGLFYTNFAPFR